MKHPLSAIFAVCALIGAFTVQAEELEIYRLSRSGPDVWGWGDARMKETFGKYVIQENNKSGQHGDVYTTDKFPYFKNGMVRLDVEQVISGTYTLQALGFKGERHEDTADLLAATAQPGSSAVLLKAKNMKQGIDSLLFKIWVGGAEGASTKIIDLAYVLPVEASDILLDERFDNTSRWEQEQVILQQQGGETIALLAPGESFGAFFCPDPISKDDASALFFDIADVENGDMTIQVVAFDSGGVYLSSVDALKQIRSGPHAVDLKEINWPKKAHTFQIKIWLGGQASARAKLKRLVVVKD